MALINRHAGFCGFTVDGINGISSDITGSVKKCIFSIVYQVRLVNVNFYISNGAEDWGAQMGDGSIIPLSNPKVLYTNRDNAIVEFDMAESYACNSPCLLVYRSDTALFKIEETDEEKPYTQNTLSGHFAFTTEGYGGKSYDNGYVDRVICTFPFPFQLTDINFSISNGADHWGARMGDGSIINLKNSQVVSINKDNAVIIFEMEESYPSNSPCLIVYRSPEATYSVTVLTEPLGFVAVEDIINVPTSSTAGLTIDLSPCSILPLNATIQHIEWSVLSGNASVTGDKLSILAEGDIRLRATILGGSNKDENIDFVKDFKITANKNAINIIAHPVKKISLDHGSINGSIFTIAKSNTGIIEYKWYRNTINSVSGAIHVSGGNKDKYIFPADIEAGIYYYYCEISSPGAETVRTNMCEVSINIVATGIKISPKITSIAYHEKIKLNVVPVPENAVIGIIVWQSDNYEIIQINSNGEIYAIGSGSTTITAKTIDGKFIDRINITVEDHIPVQSIDNLITDIEVGKEYKLTGDVIPSNATNKNINWSIVNSGTTGAIINNGSIIASSTGTIVIRATIPKGASILTDYTKDIIVKINPQFIPVTSLKVDTPSYITIEDKFSLEYTIQPSNATNNHVNWSIVNAGTTGVTITNNIISFKNQGSCTIRATIINGISLSKNFTKDIELTIHPKWVKVENIINIPELFNDVSSPLTISGSVYPQDSTNKGITYTLESYPKDLNVRFVNNVLYIDNYESVVWWVENKNPTPPYYYDKWIENITDPIIIKAVVSNGISTGEDFVKLISIPIKPPSSPELHIPIESIKLKLPSIVRARRPILMSEVEKEPWTATTDAITVGFVRESTGQGGFALSFKPKSESPDYWMNQYNIKLEDQYDWNREGFYMYIFEDIDAIITYNVQGGNADGTAYTSQERIKILPEYIPVKNITNIPDKLPYDSQTDLCGEFDTQFEITNRNTEVYDVEIPSYKDIVWTVVSQGKTGARINNGVLSFTGTGTAKIQAEVINGTKEEFTWYDIENKGESYRQTFTINVVESEKVYDIPIVKLTLDNNTIVSINKISDLYNLSNDKPSSSYITAGGIRFRKDQVKSIEFWDIDAYEDDTVYVEDITLSKNKLDTIKSNTITDDEERPSIEDVDKADDSDGCIIIEDENSVFNNMYIIPSLTFMQSNGAIIRNTDAEGDVFLNVMHASNTFFINPEYVCFPDEFIRYQWGYVYIPEGTILKGNGNLIVPNPEYGKTNNNGVKNYDVPPMLYEISIYGLVFDYINNKILLPDGSKLRASNLIKIHNYLYDHSKNTFKYEYNSIEKDFPIPDGSYINIDNDNIYLVDNIVSNVSDLTVLTYNDEKFLQLTDSSIISETGYIYSIDERLFDVYGNQVTEFINLTNNSKIIPSNATNTDIIWNLVENNIGAKLINILKDDKILCLLIPGTEKGLITINASINTADSINEFDKTFLINVGNYTNTDSKIFAINMNGLFRNVYKGYGDKSITFSANLLGTDEYIVNNSIKNITWELSGNKSSDTKLSIANNNLSATINISSNESNNNTLTLTVKYETISKVCYIKIGGLFNPNTPSIEKLTNFARNFSKLTYIDKIPLTVNGDDCLRNFLSGCTSFNQSITIPSHINGDRCLKGFLSGCTSFNQSITIPNGVTGTECLDRFLSGCTSFNQSITIPNGVTGDKCMHRFLENCSSFNKSINIPSNVSGKQCIDHFLSGCSSFNKPITIPSEVKGVACMRGFMKNTMKMTSNITISLKAANNCEVNGLTLACFTRDVAYDTGVPVIGDGADVFKSKCVNMVTMVPLRRLI